MLAQAAKVIMEKGESMQGIIVKVVAGVSATASLWLLWRQFRIWYKLRSVDSVFKSMPGDSLLCELPFGAMMKPNFFGRRHSAKYGPIYHIQAFTEPIVVVASTKLTKELYREHSQKLGRELYMVGPLLEIMQKEAIGFQDGKKWQHQRQLLRPDVLPLGVKGFYDEVIKEVNRWCQERFHDGAVLDFYESNLGILPFATFMRVFFGKMAGDAKDIADCYPLAQDFASTFGQSFSNAMFRFPLLRLLPSKHKTRAHNLHVKWRVFLEEKYGLLQSGKVAAEDGGMYARILKRAFPDGIPKLDEADPLEIQGIFETIEELLLLNNDVTVLGLMSNLAFIATNKEVFEELVAEIKVAASNVPDGELIDFSSLVSLPYLDAVMSETARIHPLVALTFPDYLKEDITLGGYHIPAGTNVCVDPDTINHDPSVWPDPWQFDPSRFLKPTGERQRLTWDFHRYGLNPRRQCVFFRYAELVMKLTLWNILRKYTVEIQGDAKEEMRKWSTDVKPVGPNLLTPYMAFPKIQLHAL